VILASALVFGTTGCTFITSQATLNQYDPSDGISGRVGDLQLRNVLAIEGEDGKAVSLLLTVVNSGGPHSLNIQYDVDGEKTTVTQVIDGNSTTSFGNTVDEEQIVLLNPGVPAGGLLPIYFQYGQVEGTQLLVPVLEATGIYSELAPPAILR
jgi:hypothetical protein